MKTFKEVFNKEIEYEVSFPYRVNWCGSYSDCLERPVITSVINRYMHFFAAPNDDDKVHVYSEEFDEIGLGNIGVENEEPLTKTWTDYVVAAITSLREYLPLTTGAFIYVDADFKSGLGLGSSAMFLTGVIDAAAEMNGIHLSAEELIKLAYKAEHKLLGIPCGLMDFKAMHHREGVWIIDTAIESPTFDLNLTYDRFNLMIAYDPHGQHQHLNNEIFANAALLEGAAASRYLEFENTFVNEITKIMNKRYDDEIRLALLGAYLLLSHRNLKEFLDIPSPYYFNNVQGVYGYKAIGSGLKGSLMLLVNPEHKYYIEETILYYGLNVVSVKTL